MNTNCEPMNWGWEINNDSFSPITTDDKPGPQDLLEMIRCNAKNLVTNGVRVESLA